MATWTSPGSPPLVFSSQAIMSLRPVPPWATLRCPIFLPWPSQSDTTCSCDAQSIPTNHLRSSCMMHFPPIGAMQARRPVDRAREHTHTHEPPQPYPVPVLALEGAVSPLGISCGRFAGAHVRTRRFGAQEYGGCSRRIGSVLNGSSVRAVARCGTSSFRYAHSACHRATTFLEPRGERYRNMASAQNCCSCSSRLRRPCLGQRSFVIRSDLAA